MARKVQAVVELNLPQLLTEEQLCRLFRVSRDAVLRFKRDPLDPIPFLKLGRRYLFELDAVLRWARRQGEKFRLELEA